MKEAAQAIVARLRGSGHTALFAGGCVRDLAMNREPKDYDVVTDALPEHVARLFRRTEKVGAKFGVVIVRLGGQMVEVATFRTDGDYADGRHPANVRFCDPGQDARRRDFTINGMFYDPAEQRIIDHVGGQEDLRCGLIRAIGDPAQRFAEDHLRMLRAVRFAARLSFEIDPATADAIRAAADRIRIISAERVRAELSMILADPTRHRGWELIHQTHLSRWLVEDSAWSDEEATDVAVRLGRLPQHCDDALALAVVFRKYLPAEAAARCRKLTCSNQVVRRVTWLLERLPRLLSCEDFEPADFKFLMADPGCQDLLALAKAEIAGRGLADRPLQIWRRHTAEIRPQ
ncbi:MAG: CCA tRNA nucleotidyltransferase, partial [Planctomycetota bacterium]